MVSNTKRMQCGLLKSFLPATATNTALVLEHLALDVCKVGEGLGI